MSSGVNEPSTEAGRRLMRAYNMSPSIRADILAIEAEAREEGMLRQLERQDHEPAGEPVTVPDPA